jgi:hypothetical protein
MAERERERYSVESWILRADKALQRANSKPQRPLQNCHVARSDPQMIGAPTRTQTWEPRTMSPRGMIPHSQSQRATPIRPQSWVVGIVAARGR